MSNKVYLHDPVNPLHYTSGGIETWDYLCAKLTPPQIEGFAVGNALKYLSRYGKKGDPVEQLKKAKWYIDKLIEIIEEDDA